MKMGRYRHPVEDLQLSYLLHAGPAARLRVCLSFASGKWRMAVGKRMRVALNLARRRPLRNWTDKNAIAGDLLLHMVPFRALQMKRVIPRMECPRPRSMDGRGCSIASSSSIVDTEKGGETSSSEVPYVVHLSLVRYVVRL